MSTKNIPIRNLATFDLNLLLALDALLAERSVTRAGARLGLSQSATSKLLNRLRAAFDDPLLLRGPGGMRPTARALALAEPVAEAIAACRRAVIGPTTPDIAGLQRDITVAATDLTDFLLLPRLLQEVRRRAPGLSLHVRPTDRLRAIDDLETGAAQLAVIPFAPGSSELRRTLLFRDSLVCIAARRRRDIGARLSLRRFLASDHVLVSLEGHGLGPVDAALAARDLKRRIALRVPGFLAVPFIVGAGDMIATVPKRLAMALARAANVRIFPPPLPVEGYSIHLVWHRRSDGDPALAWLRERIEALEAAR